MCASSFFEYLLMFLAQHVQVDLEPSLSQPWNQPFLWQALVHFSGEWILEAKMGALDVSAASGALQPLSLLSGHCWETVCRCSLPHMSMYLYAGEHTHVCSSLSFHLALRAVMCPVTVQIPWFMSAFPLSLLTPLFPQRQE